MGTDTPLSRPASIDEILNPAIEKLIKLRPESQIDTEGSEVNFLVTRVRERALEICPDGIVRTQEQARAILKVIAEDSSESEHRQTITGEEMAKIYEKHSKQLLEKPWVETLMENTYREETTGALIPAIQQAGRFDNAVWEGDKPYDRAAAIAKTLKEEQELWQQRNDACKGWTDRFPSLLSYLHTIDHMSFESVRAEIGNLFEPGSVNIPAVRPLYPMEVFARVQRASSLQYFARYPRRAKETKAMLAANPDAIPVLEDCDSDAWEVFAEMPLLALDETSCIQLLDTARAKILRENNEKMSTLREKSPTLVERVLEDNARIFDLAVEAVQNHFHPESDEMQDADVNLRRGIRKSSFLQQLQQSHAAMAMVIPTKFQGYMRKRIIRANDARERIIREIFDAMPELVDPMHIRALSTVSSQLLLESVQQLDDAELEIAQLLHDAENATFAWAITDTGCFPLEGPYPCLPKARLQLTYEDIEQAIHTHAKALARITKQTIAKANVRQREDLQAIEKERADLWESQETVVEFGGQFTLEAALENLLEREIQILCEIDPKHATVFQEVTKFLERRYSTAVNVARWKWRQENDPKPTTISRYVVCKCLEGIEHDMPRVRLDDPAALKSMQQHIEERWSALPPIIDDARVLLEFYADIDAIAEQSMTEDLYKVFLLSGSACREKFARMLREGYALQNIDLLLTGTEHMDEPEKLTAPWVKEEIDLMIARLKMMGVDNIFGLDELEQRMDAMIEDQLFDTELTHGSLEFFVANEFAKSAIASSGCPEKIQITHPNAHLILLAELERLCVRLDAGIRKKIGEPPPGSVHMGQTPWPVYPSKQVVSEKTFHDDLRASLEEMLTKLLARSPGEKATNALRDFCDCIRGMGYILTLTLGTDGIIPSPVILQAMYVGFRSICRNYGIWTKALGWKEHDANTASWKAQYENMLNILFMKAFMRFGPEPLQSSLHSEMAGTVQAFVDACTQCEYTIVSKEQRDRVLETLAEWVTAFVNQCDREIQISCDRNENAQELHRRLNDVCKQKLPLSAPRQIANQWQKEMEITMKKLGSGVGLLDACRWHEIVPIKTVISPLAGAFRPPEGTTSLEEAEVQKATLPIAHAMAQSMLDAMVNVAGGVAVKARAVSEETFSASWIDPLLDAAEAAVRDHCGTYSGEQTIKALLADHFTLARMKSCMGNCVITVSKGKSPSMAQAMRNLAPIDVANLPGDLSRDSIRTAVQNAVLGPRSDALLPEEEYCLIDLVALLHGRVPTRDECDAIAAQWNHDFHAGFALRTGEQVESALKAFLEHEVPAAPSTTEEAAPESPELAELRHLVAENSAWIEGWEGSISKKETFGLPQMVTFWHDMGRACLAAINAGISEPTSLEEALFYAHLIADMRARNLITVRETNGKQPAQKELVIEKVKMQGFLGNRGAREAVRQFLEQGRQDIPITELDPTLLDTIGMLARAGNALTEWRKRERGNEKPTTESTHQIEEALRKAREDRAGIEGDLTEFANWPEQGRREMHSQVQRLRSMQQETNENLKREAIRIEENERTRASILADMAGSRRQIESESLGNRLAVITSEGERLMRAQQTLQEQSQALASLEKQLRVIAESLSVSWDEIAEARETEPRSPSMNDLRAWIEHAETFVLANAERESLNADIAALEQRKQEIEQVMAAREQEEQEDERFRALEKALKALH